eukprot:EC125144.1.p1 GENE.EC125144.1~~EC125144.1.p1  ORF type:complete len:180 (+),score=36.49 EC125144.1:55-594(+)
MDLSFVSPLPLLSISSRHVTLDSALEPQARAGTSQESSLRSSSFLGSRDGISSSVFVSTLPRMFCTTRPFIQREIVCVQGEQQKMAKKSKKVKKADRGIREITGEEREEIIEWLNETLPPDVKKQVDEFGLLSKGYDWFEGEKWNWLGWFMRYYWAFLAAGFVVFGIWIVVFYPKIYSS